MLLLLSCASGGPHITGDQINTLFVQDDYAAYQLNHMPVIRENEYNYEAFTHNIFER